MDPPSERVFLFSHTFRIFALQILSLAVIVYMESCHQAVMPFAI